MPGVKGLKGEMEPEGRETSEPAREHWVGDDWCRSTGERGYWETEITRLS